MKYYNVITYVERFCNDKIKIINTNQLKKTPLCI